MGLSDQHFGSSELSEFVREVFPKQSTFLYFDNFLKKSILSNDDSFDIIMQQNFFFFFRFIVFFFSNLNRLSVICLTCRKKGRFRIFFPLVLLVIIAYSPFGELLEISFM